MNRLVDTPKFVCADCGTPILLYARGWIDAISGGSYEECPARPDPDGFYSYLGHRRGKKFEDLTADELTDLDLDPNYPKG
jgi:hypothetical protein